MSSEDHGRDRFTSKASVYDGRPEWPDFIYELMLQKTGFDPNNKEHMRQVVAVDIGAGTGKTTFPLADLGCTVIAVEPNDKMLEKLKERKAQGKYDNVVVVKGDAKKLNIPKRFKHKVNLFYCGNAAHWWGSRVKGNGTWQEKRVAKSWAPYAALEAQMAVMYLRATEDDPYVRELRDIMFKHFELTRNNPTEPCSMRLFESDAFSDYFNAKSLKPSAEDYVRTEFVLRDYEHFKSWLCSHSYFPSDGFENPAAEKDFKGFYDRAVERGGGVAKIAFGVRLYTGDMRETIPHRRKKGVDADDLSLRSEIVANQISHGSIPRPTR